MYFHTFPACPKYFAAGTTLNTIQLLFLFVVYFSGTLVFTIHSDDLQQIAHKKYQMG